MRTSLTEGIHENFKCQNHSHTWEPHDSLGPRSLHPPNGMDCWIGSIFFLNIVGNGSRG